MNTSDRIFCERLIKIFLENTLNLVIQILLMEIKKIRQMNFLNQGKENNSNFKINCKRLSNNFNNKMLKNKIKTIKDFLKQLQEVFTQQKYYLILKKNNMQIGRLIMRDQNNNKIFQ